jgi:sulfite exporter TauE/SafE
MLGNILGGFYILIAIGALFRTGFEFVFTSIFIIIFGLALIVRSKMVGIKIVNKKS